MLLRNFQAQLELWRQEHACSGVIVSALISFGIAVRTAKLEITKIRYEIQYSKAEKLAEERLEIYPTLYALQNKLNFSTQDKNLKVEELMLLSFCLR